MKFTSLSQQILTIFIAVVVLSLGLSGWGLTALAQRIITDNLIHEHQELARRIANELNQEVENIRPILSFIAESSDARAMDPDLTAAALLAYQLRFPELATIYVADLNGRQIARTDGQPLENVAATLGFQVAREGHELISDVYISQDKAEPTLTFFQPIIKGPEGANSSQPGEQMGVLVADVNFSRVQAILALPALSRSETAVVFAPNGQVIAHSRMAELDRLPALSDPQLIETLVQGPSGVLNGYTDELGRTVIGAHTPVANLGWSVVIQTPLAELNSDLAALRRTMIIGLLGGITLTVIAGWLMANRLAKPINQLVQATEQVAAGDFSTSVNMTTSDEIERLTGAFNQMVASIRQNREELLQSKARLERSHRILADKVAKLEALHHISIAISSQMETETLLQRLVEQARVLLDAVSCSILLPDEETGELVFRAAADDVVGHRIPPGQGVAFRVLRERAPQIIHQVAADPDHYAKTGQESGIPTQSLLAAPLLVSDRTIGVLEAVNKQEGYFDEEDLELLMTMAGHAAVAIENAQLYDRLQEYAVTLEDRVTERTAELAVAKERAEEADHLKSAFLATMSHELRTPLNSIIGFVGIMLQGLAGPLNSEQEKQLNMVYGSAKHLLDLINDVLDISKIEAGEVKLQRETFDFSVLIDEALHIMMPIAEKKGLALTAAGAADLGPFRSDKRRVEQILLNLINNAIKFTENGRVHIDCSTSDAYLQVSVHDTGIGIKAEDLPTLFQEFRQIDTGLTRKHEGTGLGLAICKKLVVLLEGKIWVESEWGRGSTFIFTLPLA